MTMTTMTAMTAMTTMTTITAITTKTTKYMTTIAKNDCRYNETETLGAI